jgi:hypothetical protein
MRNKFFILGLFVILLSSCRSSRQVVQQTRIDSTAVSFREVEKIIRIPGDTVVLVMPVKVKVPCPESVFIPMQQTAETKRSSVKLEVNEKGDIKATAICKDLEETIVVLEKTISNYKSEVTEYQVKESRLKSAMAEMRSWLNGILISLLLIAGISLAFKLGFNPISILKNSLKKS